MTTLTDADRERMRAVAAALRTGHDALATTGLVTDTRDVLARMEAEGRHAYESGAPTAAPAANSAVRDAIAGMAVGTGAADIMRAYSRGWDAAADEAARRLLTEE